MNSIARNFRYELKGNSSVIYLNETLDISTSAYFERCVSDLINGHPGNDVIINMTHVPYMSSAGLGVLIVLTKRLEENNRKLKITNLNHTLQKVISLLDAEGLVNIYDDEPEALAG